MAASNKADALNPKQRAFCREYIKDHNATQAAIRAGYSPKAANRQASRLLSNVDIQAGVAQAQEERNKAALVTENWVLVQLKSIAENGNDQNRTRALDLIGRYLGMWERKQQEQTQEGVRVELGELEAWAE